MAIFLLVDASLVKTMATLADQIHENAQLKKQLVKLEEKLILKEMKEKEQKEKIKDLETQIDLETSVLIWKNRVELGNFTVDGRSVKPWRYFDRHMI